MKGKVSYLIKEEGALIGDLKFSLPVFMGIGKGSFYMSEQLTFKQDSLRAPISTLTITSFDLADNR